MMEDEQNLSYGWSKEMPVSLQEKLKQDLKTAMRSKDNIARDTVRQIMSEFPGLTVSIRLESGKKTTRLKKPEEITDDDIIDIVRRLVKAEKTVLEAKKEETSRYLQLLERYLPRTADQEEILAWIEANINFNDYKSPMQAMGPIMKHFGQQADGNQVKQILQQMHKQP
jgi:uncharacterized protein YqeY